MRGDLGQPEPILSAGAIELHSARFRVGGVSIHVTGDQFADVTLVSSLEPFRVEETFSDINIQIERTPRLPQVPGRQLFDSGSVWRLYDGEDQYRFDFSTPAMGEEPYKRLLVDRKFQQARLLISAESLARVSPPAAPLDYPLDELLITHRLTQEKAIELHSCGVVRSDGNGDLFVGHSEAGKSTTARLWSVIEGVEILSDDRIIVRRDEIHLGEATMPKMPVAPMRMYGTPWHGEAAYASPGSAPLQRIFILQHGHGNVLTQLNPSQAVAELFARSFVPFHRHEYIELALEFLQEVVDAVPCYRYAFEPNKGAVERIMNFRG
jgi:hypothetical protein